MASAVIKSSVGDLQCVEIVPVIQAAAYAAGDLLGGKITLANLIGNGGGAIEIVGVVVTDNAKQAAALDILFFDTDPAATTFTENGAVDIDDADLLNAVGFIQVTSYSQLNDNAIGRGEVTRPIHAILAGTSLYAAIVNRGTPTYAAVTDLALRVFYRRA